MVEYKKKKLILQSGGTRNYYYKVISDGKKKQVSKIEYLEKKGGTINENNNLLLSLMEVSNKLNNNENKNYKKLLSNQIEELVFKKFKKFTDLNSILEFISTILREGTLEKPIVNLILKKLAENLKENWTELQQVLKNDINIFTNDELIKCLVRLLDFVATKKVTKDDIRFIIQKIIREIFIKIRDNTIIIPDSLGNRNISVYKRLFEVEKVAYNTNKLQISTHVKDKMDRFAYGLMYSVYRNT